MLEKKQGVIQDQSAVVGFAGGSDVPELDEFDDELSELTEAMGGIGLNDTPYSKRQTERELLRGNSVVPRRDSSKRDNSALPKRDLSELFATITTPKEECQIREASERLAQVEAELRARAEAELQAREVERLAQAEIRRQREIERQVKEEAERRAREEVEKRLAERKRKLDTFGVQRPGRHKRRRSDENAKNVSEQGKKMQQDEGGRGHKRKASDDAHEEVKTSPGSKLMDVTNSPLSKKPKTTHLCINFQVRKLF